LHQFYGPAVPKEDKEMVREAFGLVFCAWCRSERAASGSMVCI
jgi:hypothetical protein